LRPAGIGRKLSRMANADSIENRVYLFESLAKAWLAQGASELGAEKPARRAKALRALAELAWVSCVVADTGHQSPEAVRDRILARAQALVAKPKSKPAR
jgi:hypothetical protein